MADEPVKRPLLNPVLKFTRDPRPEGITGGGKNATGIRTERLTEQRKALSEAFASIHAQRTSLPQHGKRVILYASMFADSHAPTWTPGDIFNANHGATLIAPFRAGYLVEVETNRLQDLSGVMATATTAREMVDISRVEAVRPFDADDASHGVDFDELWDEAPEVDDGRAFVVWLMPFAHTEAVDSVLRDVERLRGDILLPAPNATFDNANSTLSATLSSRLAIQSADSIATLMRDYRLRGRGKATIVLPNQDALVQLTASGGVFRLDPVVPITSTSPGEGAEPNRPLPQDLSSMPIVGVVDGGLTAASYKSAEAWRAPALIKDAFADAKHGNRVASLIVQGHDWNNNLTLPALYCQVGVVQAVPREKTKQFVSTTDFIAYLDAVMTARPETKVWNFSLNQKIDCEFDQVSELGHAIAMLARKHKVLPIISIGNKPGDRMQPPADCEAALTVGGRLHTSNGKPGQYCTVSTSGPGPSSMLKPELAHFSHVRAIGGAIVPGSSFSAALTSPLAAHTMAQLRDPNPDLVKALLLNQCDGHGFDPAIGFGSPSETMPWNCAPGMVTLQWSASLKAGAAYYWELPIPLAMRKTGKLRGQGTLTAIINPHPLVSEYGGANYFSVRLATALQYERGNKFHNFLGSIDTKKITEEEARANDHKWSPVRHHHAGVSSHDFDGDNLRVYGRIFTRDLFLYGYSHPDETPEMDVEFVLSIGTGDSEDDIYGQVFTDLGSYVENATINADLEVTH